MDRFQAEYFLSCYLSPPGNLAVLAPRHDQGVALWRRNGPRVELARVWELERISGQKHHTWPLYTAQRARGFLEDLLGGEGLRLSDIGAVWGTPGLPGEAPVRIPAGAEQFPVHSLAHLFSGLLLDTQVFRHEVIVGMAVDGAPDTVLDLHNPSAWYAGCIARAGHLDFSPVESPGPLYTAASTVLGLEPGSLMALATACRTRMRFDIEAATSRLSLLGGREPPWEAAFGLVAALVDEARQQLADRDPDSGFTTEENIGSAVMKHVQHACDLIAIRTVERLCDSGRVDAKTSYLAVGGGFALNCPTNTLLLDRFGFRGLLAPPCANDSGQALGLGLLGLHGNGVFDEADLRIDSAYYGSPLRDVEAALSKFSPWIKDVTPFAAGQFARDITDGILAWVDGQAEIGPRALGHRSLLGDPRSLQVKERLNECKRRQWWRPVAPIVQAEHSAAWFEQGRPSPYMLEAVTVRPEVRDKVPAIVHLDGTARHQTITVDSDPLLYSAMDAFRLRTGIPILCNTSLNDKGEPIVNSVAEALTFCVNRGIEVAYIVGRRVVLRPRSSGLPAPDRPCQRAVSYFAGQEQDRDEIWASWQKRGYTDAGICLLTWSPSIRRESSMTRASIVNRLAQHYVRSDPAFAALVESFRRDTGPGSYFVRQPDDLPQPFIVN